MKKLTMQERIKRYIARHPQPRKTMKCIFLDGPWDSKTPAYNIATFKRVPSPCQSRWRTMSFGTCYRYRYSPEYISYMDVDKNLGLFEMSIVRVCTKPATNKTVDRTPKWICRRFFEIKGWEPYDETGTYNRHWDIPYNSQWRASSYLGDGVTFLTRFCQRATFAKEGMKLSDCLGKHFVNGVWEIIQLAEEAGEPGVGPWWYFYRYFTLVHLTKPRPAPKPRRTPPLTRANASLWQKELAEGTRELQDPKVLGMMAGSPITLGKVYRYNVLVYPGLRYEYIRGSRECVRELMYAFWNPNSRNPKFWCWQHTAYYNPWRDDIPQDEHTPVQSWNRTIPEAAAFAAVLDRSGSPITKNLIRRFVHFQHPLTEALVKIAPTAEELWDYPIKDLFPHANMSARSLWQKIGLNKEQFQWLCAHHRFITYIERIVQSIRYAQKVPNTLSLTEFKSHVFSNVDYSLGSAVRAAMSYFNLSRSSAQMNTFMDALLEEKFGTNLTALKDAMDIACRLREAGEEQHPVSFKQMMNMSTADIARWHDEVMGLNHALQERIRAAQDAELRRLCEQAKGRRKKFEYEEDDYLLRMPASLEEIRQEGSVQHICIGSYAHSYATGRTNLFFVRKKSDPSTPFLAIEMTNDKNIVQIHGKFNAWAAYVDPNVVPFLYRWVEKNKITCSDRILLLKAQGYNGTGTMMAKPKY